MKIKFTEWQPGIYGVEINGRFSGFAEARGDARDLIEYFGDGFTHLIPSIGELGLELDANLTGLYVAGDNIPMLRIRLLDTGDGLVMGNGLTYRTRSSGRRLCLRETQQGLEDFLSKLTPLIDWEAGEFREPVEVSFHLRSQGPGRANGIDRTFERMAAENV